MDERIRELVEQAIQDVDAVELSKMYIAERFAERFAELLIRECSAVCDDGEGFASSLAENVWMNHCRDLILKHFGLEKI